jgi:hypothetical protein
MDVTSLFFGKLFVLCKVVTEVSSWHDVDYNEQILSVLECKMHVYQEPIIVVVNFNSILSLGNKKFPSGSTQKAQ